MAIRRAFLSRPDSGLGQLAATAKSTADQAVTDATAAKTRADQAHAQAATVQTTLAARITALEAKTVRVELAAVTVPVLTPGSSRTTTVVWPTAFPAPPTVRYTYEPGLTGKIEITIGQITPTGCTVTLRALTAVTAASYITVIGHLYA